MSYPKLLLLGLIYLPIGFIIGHFYTLSNGETSTENIDTQQLSPWEQRYQSMKQRLKEMGKLVDNFYVSEPKDKNNGQRIIDTNKVLASVNTLVNEQYTDMEADVKQNIVDLCQSINKKMKK